MMHIQCQYMNIFNKFREIQTLFVIHSYDIFFFASFFGEIFYYLFLIFRKWEKNTKRENALRSD